MPVRLGYDSEHDTVLALRGAPVLEEEQWLEAIITHYEGYNW